MTDTMPPLPEPIGAIDLDCGPAPGGGRELLAVDGFTAHQLRAYGQQCAAAERERCAMVCEQADDDGEGPDCWGWHAKDYAKAIRALPIAGG